MYKSSFLRRMQAGFEDSPGMTAASQTKRLGGTWEEPVNWRTSSQGGSEEVCAVAGSAMGSMPTVNDEGYDAVDEMEMVIDDDHRPTSSTLLATRAPMLRGNQNGAGCMMSKLPRGSTMAVDHGGEEAGNKTERVTRSKTGHLPNTFPRSQSDGTCGHTTNSTTDHESSYCSCQAVDEEDCECEEKSEKWRKRDKIKHLAGERSRRQKRMGRLYELRDLLNPFTEKATVNNILQQAAKQIKEILAEEARTGSKVAISKPCKQASGRAQSRHRRTSIKKETQPAHSIVHQDFAADAFHIAAMNSSTTALFVLDLQHRVVEASNAMMTMIGGKGGSAQGVHPHSFMNHDDFDAIVREEESLRSAISSRGRSMGQSRMFTAEARFITGRAGTALPFPIEVTVLQGNTMVMILPLSQRCMQTSPPPKVASPEAPDPSMSMTVCNNNTAPVWFGGPIPLEGTFVLVESFRLPDLMSLLGCTAHQNNMYAWEACQACWPADQWEMFGASDVVVDEIIVKMQVEPDGRAITRQEMAITDGCPEGVSLRSDSFSLDGIACVVSTETGDEAVCHTSLADAGVIQQWYNWRCAGGNSICLSKRWTATPQGLTCDLMLSYAGSQIPNARLYFQRLQPS